jgi:NAD(P)-dependent dehydrogenase (short-subunit alcohol dehydrogenase family)
MASTTAPSSDTTETKQAQDAFFPGRFKGQVAVVTGGARGIGFAIATRLLQEGAHVALLDLGKDSLAEAVASLQKMGFSSVSSYVTNVADYNSVEKNFEAIYNDQGSIDVLVQSAGIVGATGKKAHEVDVTGV